ncbi:MAG: hypothetical protein KAS32_11570, partial [Candidatus Peribacteraceae bacterium]|nr:hypothetical protein [Candidatus Peribacteraceae bacterium]
RLHCGIPQTGAASHYTTSNDATNARFDTTSFRTTRGSGTTLSGAVDANSVAPEFKGGDLTEALIASPSRYPFIGRIIVDFGMIDSNEKRYFGGMASLLGASFGADPRATPEITLHQGVLARNVAVDSMRYQIYLAEEKALTLGGVDGLFPVQGPVADRAWIYGVFNTEQQSELGEY